MVKRGGAVKFKYDLLRSHLNNPVFAKFINNKDHRKKKFDKV